MEEEEEEKEDEDSSEDDQKKTIEGKPILHRPPRPQLPKPCLPPDPAVLRILLRWCVEEENQQQRQQQKKNTEKKKKKSSRHGEDDDGGGGSSQESSNDEDDDESDSDDDDDDDSDDSDNEDDDEDHKEGEGTNRVRERNSAGSPSSSVLLSFSMAAIEAARRVLRIDPVNDEALNQLLLAHHQRNPSSSSFSLPSDSANPSLSLAGHPEINRELECVEAIASRMDYGATTINVTTAAPTTVNSKSRRLSSSSSSSPSPSSLSSVSCWTILSSHLLSLKKMLQQLQKQASQKGSSTSSSKECVPSFPLPEDARFAFQDRYDWWMRSGQHFGCMRADASTATSDKNNWEQARHKCRRLIEEIFW
mmetsp:Transcript_4468/g.7172  ORF Transcript_4468/g.7172 Transcript_4468/m.7172 type:complete len:363 (+) Transcript_4468:1714-2802(+)